MGVLQLFGMINALKIVKVSDQLIVTNFDFLEWIRSYLTSHDEIRHHKVCLDGRLTIKLCYQT